MAIWNVHVEVTYSGDVVVEADTAQHARGMAERGPGAWLNGLQPEAMVHVHTEAQEAHREDADVGEDDRESA